MTLKELGDRITDRVNAFQYGNPDAVLDSQALVELAEFERAATVAGGAAQLAAQRAAIWLFWARNEARHGAGGHVEYRTALQLSLDLAATTSRLDAVPEPMRNRLQPLFEHGPRTFAQLADYLTTQASGENPETLAPAIETCTLAILVLPPDDHDWAICQTNLGILLGSRYRAFGALEDLEAAVEACRGAVGPLQKHDPDRAKFGSNLCSALVQLFEQNGDNALLDEAIAVGRAAVADTLEGHPNRVGRMTNLWIAYQLRFRATGVPSDLTEAIRWQHAVSAAGGA